MSPRTAAAFVVAALFLTPLTSHAQGREQTADQQVLHVLNRLAFGPRPGEAARVRSLGVNRWIAQQLEPSGIRDTVIASIIARHPGVTMEQAEITRLYRAEVAARRADGRAQPQGPEPVRPRRASDEARRLNAAIADVGAARLARAIESERQLEEVMVDFWANHFSVARSKGQTRLFLAQYERDAIRPHAMGRFRDLLGAVAKSPAMLFYLDNARSVADQPAPRAARRPQAPNRSRGINENYARELLELHTLGVDGGYTQQDVMEVARALTGWSIEPASGSFTFRRAQHDRGAKQVLGMPLPAGKGIEDGEAVLDLLTKHPATARHIARKLVVRLVSDSAPPALVDRAAATFTRTGGDITETVRTIVTSDEFFSREAWRAKVKTPFELVASTYRALGQAPDATPRATQLVARLGQPIYGRQTPDGWPDTGGEWMTAGAILSRINFGLLTAGGRVPGVQLARWPAYAKMRAAGCELRGPAGNSDTRCAAAVDIVVNELLGGSVSVETREILMSGTNPLLTRPAAASDSLGASVRGIRLDPMQQLVGLALGAPEFQRR